MSTPVKRYTAVVKIIEVTETPEEVTGYNRDKLVPAGKLDKELASFTVRDADLESLKVKLAKHVELV